MNNNSLERKVKMTTIAIVGLGVVGGSFAQAIKQKKLEEFEVLAIDKDEQTLKKALEEGTILEGETENKTILQRADIVITALYPRAMKDFVKTHEDEFKEGAIVTDTTGVKGALIDNMKEYIPKQVDFIFGHPMAGRESSGYEYASGTIFEGSNYLLTPIHSNKKENIDRLVHFFKQLGFKRVTIVSPEKHDEMIAFTSQLCHAIAVSLINSDDSERDTVSFIGDSYRDLTRIAKINETLWPELFIENKEALLEAMGQFETQFARIKEAVVNDQYEDLEEYFIESTKRRTRLEESDSITHLSSKTALINEEERIDG